MVQAMVERKNKVEQKVKKGMARPLIDPACAEADSGPGLKRRLWRGGRPGTQLGAKERDRSTSAAGLASPGMSTDSTAAPCSAIR